MTSDYHAIARGILACLVVLACGHGLAWVLRSYPPSLAGRSDAPMATPMASRP